MKKKVGFVSLGCPKNLIDTEVMLGHMTRAGYELTSEPAEAEILVVNTCGFIDQAKQESIDTILEMAQYKNKGRCRRLVVSGCLAQRYARDIAREIPEIDVVTGLDSLESIVSTCETDERLVEPLRADASSAYLYDHQSPRVLSTPRFSAYIKISEGCDYPCTFCIIPKIRGHYRSRTPESILAEAESLAGKGIREIVLIAQDTTRYGVELGLRNGLADLLRQLARVEGVEWIRFLYAYPTTITDAVLEAMADEPAVCRYVDMPLQHTSDPILKAMKRPGTAESNRKLIEHIRAAVPGVSVRSSFIVGFPGETPDDFQKLLNFCREAQFDHLGVFVYSHEEGTEAYGHAETVPDDEKVRRRDELMSVQEPISLGLNRRRVGERIRVLVEGPSPETELLIRARTEGQAPDIDGSVLINDGYVEAGTFATVEVTEAHSYDLVAGIVGKKMGTVPHFGR
jgi:ribosomal protein S12 methylthiotransferase